MDWVNVREKKSERVYNLGVILFRDEIVLYSFICDYVVFNTDLNFLHQLGWDIPKIRSELKEKVNDSICKIDSETINKEVSF